MAFTLQNITALAEALRQFGFNVPEPSEEFLAEDEFLGLGNSPLRIEILTAIDGVNFDECYRHRQSVILDGVSVNFIGLHQLLINKRVAGRFKDLNDLKNLPPAA